MTQPTTLYDKLWNSHLVTSEAEAVAWGRREIPVRFCNDYERGVR